MILAANNLTYTYEDAPLPALESLTATFAAGWTGIVGSNGAGKSTLLRLLCGEVRPDSGTVSPPVKGVYCAQGTECPPPNLEELACDYSSDAVRIRSALGLDDEWLWRFDTLSHGERKRVQVACALQLQPAVLALDEPTNHLDAPTRALLLDALGGYRGVGLLVSHDRAFLDALVYQCCLLDEGVATVVPGTYSQAKAQMDLRYKGAAAERRCARDQLARLQGERVRRKAEAARASSRRSARHLDRHDSDGRARIGLAVVSGQDGKTGLLSAQMDKRVEAAQERLERARVKKVYDKPLDIRAKPAGRKVLAQVEAGALSLGDARTLRFPNLFLGNRDRVGLQGPNGAGKSTFLRFLLADLMDDPGVVWLPQEASAAERRAVLGRLAELSRAQLGRVLSVVARLNSPPKRILSGDELSPGELRKVMLACGLLREPYLVAMDEPTNHLDIRSVEALQDVLAACGCALVLVSHDQAFLDALTTTRWVFEAQAEDASDDAARGDTRLTVRLR